MIIAYDREINFCKFKSRCILGMFSAVDSAAAASKEYWEVPSKKSWDIPYCTFIWHHNHSITDTYEWYISISYVGVLYM